MVNKLELEPPDSLSCVYNMTSMKYKCTVQAVSDIEKKYGEISPSISKESIDGIDTLLFWDHATFSLEGQLAGVKHPSKNPPRVTSIRPLHPVECTVTDGVISGKTLKCIAK